MTGYQEALSAILLGRESWKGSWATNTSHLAIDSSNPYCISPVPPKISYVLAQYSQHSCSQKPSVNFQPKFIQTQFISPFPVNKKKNPLNSFPPFFSSSPMYLHRVITSPLNLHFAQLNKQSCSSLPQDQLSHPTSAFPDICSSPSWVFPEHR